mmetsp:Transcript_7172/g.8082  ORF Transcript_7172/g.8082 Transcript_7172/m.8082 type:complete len:188 (-) Transcript_7172:55-618(-)
MEKTSLVIILLGVALLAYSPITQYLSTDKSCTCDKIEEFVSWAEGKEYCVYKDTLDIPTIGIGFNLQRSDAKGLIEDAGANFDKILAGTQCLTDSQITKIFTYDLTWAESGAKSCISSYSTHSKCIQEVLIDMTFNMGKGSLCKWPKFQSQLASHDYNSAAANMKVTKWCGQVGRRCTRNVDLVQTC